ncbi:MAG TPA: hypothetical protein VKU19_34245 [Bryobacteraceae bacterium]|nr:hypothetical protein [Bryobacteraceae bacterium]
MSSISNDAKLARLRAKTNEDLVRYLTRELNLGVRLAAEADDQSLRRAEESYSEIARLLPLVSSLDRSEQSRIEARFQRLRDILDAQISWRTHRSVRTAAGVL